MYIHVCISIYGYIYIYIYGEIYDSLSDSSPEGRHLIRFADRHIFIYSYICIAILTASNIYSYTTAIAILTKGIYY